MGIRGTAPKDQKTGRYQNVTGAGWTDVRDVPYQGTTPSNPWVMEDPYLSKWWDTLCSMPHCILWNESDWQYALDTSLMKARFYDGTKAPNAAVLTELRKREEAMGMTYDARLKLRIRYVPVPEDEQKREAAKVLNLVATEDDLEGLFDDD